MDERPEHDALRLGRPEPDARREPVGEPGHPWPARRVVVEVGVARARLRREVDRLDLGDRPAHLERVADGREESVVGERQLEEVVGAGVDARGGFVE